MLRVLLERDDPAWVKLVGVCVFAYNTTLDLILENPAEKYVNTQDL